MKTFFIMLVFAMCISTTALSQWVQTSGPEGGAVFTIFPDGGNLYAGMAAAGVFRSTDGGATWEQKINGMGYQSTAVINRSGSYLLATGTVGLYRSTDNGDTWVTATGLPAGNGVGCLAVIGTDVFAGTMGRGVYKSTDNGDTWAPANSGLPNSGVNVQVGGIVASGTTLLASATDNSIASPMYRSTDMGATWSLAATGLPANYFQYDAMYADGSTVYAGGTRLFKTTNNGDNWTAADNGIPEYSGIGDIAANGSLAFAAAFTYLYRSIDNGLNWSTVGGGLPFMYTTSVSFDGSTIYAGTIANGVYKSTDNGDTWTQMVIGLRARDMNSFLIDGSTLYGNGNGVFATTDQGDTWINKRGNMRDSASMPTLLYANGSTMFVREATNPDRVSRTTDGGTTWTFADNGIPGLYSASQIISTGGALLIASSRVYRSTDNGDTWTQVDTALSGFIGFSGLIETGGTLYAYGLGIGKSTDGGLTWVKADSGIAAFFGVGGFASIGSTLFAGGGFPNAVYKSSNGGAYWTTGTPIPSSGGTSQLLALDNDLFACSPNNGIFISKNLGTSWTKISTGLPNSNYLYSLAILNGTMYAGTSGNAVWKRPLSDVTAVEEIVGNLPTEFMLSQNYPNPFNPSTNFEFRIANLGFVKLSVFDILGREVVTLVNESLQPGTYRVSWNAADQPSGIYYYRLRAGAYSETKKMMLVK